jgi:hypothetical protein
VNDRITGISERAPANQQKCMIAGGIGEGTALNDCRRMFEYRPAIEQVQICSE